MAKCNLCHKAEASVRLTTLINGQKAELFLCELCAKQEKSIAMNDLFLNPDINMLDQIQKDLQDAVPGLSGVDKELLQEAAKEIQNAIKGLGLQPADVEALMPSKTCPKCGITWEEIKKTSKFGCPYDYEYFEEDFQPTMRRLHLGGSKHVGKVPTHLNIPVSQQVVALEQKLAVAVKEERYEEAAQLRDQIKALKGNGDV